MIILLAIIIIELALLGYLVISKLSNLATIIEEIKNKEIDWSGLEDIKLNIITKDDIIKRMSVKEAMNEYKACQRLLTGVIKNMSELAVNIVASGVAKALSGKKGRNSTSS
jgi:Mrp family chromosome partitioning ATPase